MADEQSGDKAFAGGWFTPAEFAGRRAKVLDSIGPDACAVLQGAGPVAGFEMFRQTNEFFYLCGVEIPQAYLLLDGATRATTLFLPHRPERSTGGGESLTAEDADAVVALTGVDSVLGLEALTGKVAGVGVIYTPHNPVEGRMACQDTLRHVAALVARDPWDEPLSRQGHFTDRLRTRFPGADLRDLSPVLDEMRRIKSPAELAIMRKAAHLSAVAITEAMKSTQPGIFEYHLEAVADGIFRANGARGAGYQAIVPTAGNIWHAHYCRNDQMLRAGDLVLMDYAPDVCNYTSDIGRMWPVNGHYTPVQRALYGFMVHYHTALLRLIKPGALPRQILAEAAEQMRPVVERARLGKPAYREAALRTLEFAGNLSHPVGMAVHDVGSYFDRPMEPGLVITVDPQMWIPEEQLYIRVEDTIAVTDSGIEIMTQAAPLDLDLVESIVGTGGLLQHMPIV
jgi:Xaa-Pro aminopeptidase